MMQNKKILKKILSSIKESGQYYRYRIKEGWGEKEFKENIPIIKYDDIKDKLMDAYNGEEGYFTKEKIVTWANTSGTTENPKYIPFTKSFIEDYGRAEKKLFYMILRMHPNIIGGKIIILTGKKTNCYSPNGINVGSVSGIMADRIPNIFKSKIIGMPNEVDKNDDSKRIDYVVQESIYEDVRLVIATSSTFLMDYLLKIKDGIRGKSIRDIWPKLSVVGYPTGGYASIHKNNIMEILNGVAIIDTGFGATEGYLSRSIGFDEPVGIPNDELYYIEFRKYDENNKITDTIMLSDVKIGEKYRIIISSRNGILRYDMNDIVVFEKRKKKKVMRYIGRDQHEISILGERVTENQVLYSMKYASEKVGIDIKEFILIGPKDERMPYKYSLLIDNEEHYKKTGNVLRIMVNEFDNKLKEINPNYRNIREYSRFLKAPLIKCIPTRDINDIRQKASSTSIYSGQGKNSSILANRM